jgi:hypothetical protein
MDFIAALSHDSRRLMIETIAQAVGTNAQYFEEILQITRTAKDMKASRAARVIDMVCENFPEMGNAYVNEIAQNLIDVKCSKTKRSLCRVLTRHLPDNEELLGALVHHGFEYLYSTTEPVALKVYAMQVLFNVSELIPDLKPELIEAIEQELPKNSVGFNSRGKMLLKMMRKSKI